MAKDTYVPTQKKSLTRLNPRSFKRLLSKVRVEGTAVVDSENVPRKIPGDITSVARSIQESRTYRHCGLAYRSAARRSISKCTYVQVANGDGASLASVSNLYPARLHTRRTRVQCRRRETQTNKAPNALGRKMNGRGINGV